MAAISITLSPLLSEHACAAAAKEQRPVEQLVEAAVSRYLRTRETLEDVLRESHAYGKSIGLRSEEDVQRIADGEITLEQLQSSRSS